MQKIPKKWTLKIQKSKIVILVLNQSSISAVFPIVQFAGDPKTALTGDPLYFDAHTPLFWTTLTVRWEISQKGISLIVYEKQFWNPKLISDYSDLPN